MLPGWALNVATIIHSDEALLATGFIFTVHFFNTHLRPEKFPMDMVIFTGRMDVDELKEDKPGEYEKEVAAGTLESRLAEPYPVSYTHLRAHETVLDLVCRLLLHKKKQKLFLIHISEPTRMY
mgnify:CR=1 FL=1